MDEWKIEVDETAVRKLLGEHTATFPAIHAVPTIGGSNSFLGRFRPWRQEGPAIDVACRGHRTRRNVRKTIIYELRHWWQYAGPERLRRIKRSHKNNARVFWSLIACGVVSGLVGGVGWFSPRGLFLIAVLYAVFSCLLVGFLVAGDSSEETDARWFALTRNFDPRWQRAIRVSKVARIAKGDE